MASEKSICMIQPRMKTKTFSDYLKDDETLMEKRSYEEIQNAGSGIDDDGNMEAFEAYREPCSCD